VNPAATVMVGGAEIRVPARLARDDERVRLRARLPQASPAYTAYEHRSASRNRRIFRLERTS
jgi:hypothetical protein